MDQSEDRMDDRRRAGTRYQALDAWRGIVCLVVVLEHAGVALWHADLRAIGLGPLVEIGDRRPL